MISQLPSRYALVLRGGMSPVIARLPMAWRDPTYKRARRAGHATAALTAAEPTGLFRDLPRLRGPWRGDDAETDFVPPVPSEWDDPDRYPWQ